MLLSILWAIITALNWISLSVPVYTKVIITFATLTIIMQEALIRVLKRNDDNE